MIPEKNINKQKKNNNQKDKTDKKKKKRKCYFCYKEKHYIKDCFERKNFKNLKKTLIGRLQLHLKMMLTLMELMSLLLQKSSLLVSGFSTQDVIFICVTINNCLRPLKALKVVKVCSVIILPAKWLELGPLVLKCMMV